MDKIKVCDFLSFILALWLGVVTYNFYTFQKQIKSNMVRIDSSLVMIKKESTINKVQMDSIQNTNRIFAKSILYLDSCQVQKATKMDKAEKRGRFLGGLLKGLFPGI